MSDSLKPTKRTTLRRHPERGSYDREVVHAILDQGLVCHVGIATDDGPVVIPMGYARRGEELLLHGSAKSRLLNELAEGAPVCVTVTHLDGLVLARSTFHHSMNYRSVVVLGNASRIEDEGEKAAALEALVEHLVPGRTRDARPANEGELAATLVVRVPLAEASAKIRSGPPVDDAADLALPVWAGVLPFERRAGEPQRDEHTDESLPVPDYLRSYPDSRA